jgi:hypothetical protein
MGVSISIYMYKYCVLFVFCLLIILSATFLSFLFMHLEYSKNFYQTLNSLLVLLFFCIWAVG